MPTTFKSHDEYLASKGQKPAPIASGDPFAKFHRTGWWSNGEIVVYKGEKGEDKPLPTTIHVDSITLAKRHAREGWVPIEFVSDPVLDLLIAYHGGPEKLPEEIAGQLKERLLARLSKK